MASISIGNELKDGFKETNNWVTNNINFLGDIEQFYQQRSLLEKEYATKLNALTAEFLSKKANKTTSISVGDSPKVTPGSLESATMVTWNEVLTRTEEISRSHGVFANELSSKVVDQITSLKTSLNHHKSKLEGYHNSSLLKSKEDFTGMVNKAKKHYDDTCQAMETARAKAEKSSKYEKKLNEKKTEMNIAKNQYLLTVNVANRLKDKFYYQDLPEILDLFQDLNEFKTKRLNTILNNASILETKKNERDSALLQQIKQTVQGNDYKLDTQMFIKHNAETWKEPQDFYYVPSSIWHEDDTFVVENSELLELKKVLKLALQEDQQFGSKVEQSKESLASLAQKKTSYKSQTDAEFELKKSLDILSTYLLSLSALIADENRKVKAQVEVETIENNVQGDIDLNVDNLTVSTKKAGFFDKLRGSSKRKSVVTDNNSDLSPFHNDDGDSQSIISGSQHSVKSSSTSHHGFRISSLLRSKSVHSTNSTIHSTVLQGTALYAYQAQGSDEASMTPGEIFSVGQTDDGSGWTLIHKSSGEEGLVPTSYLSIESVNDTSSTPGKKKGPAVPKPRGSGKKHIKVTYPYTAEDEGELSIYENETLELVEADDGSGWTKGRNENGQIGLSNLKNSVTLQSSHNNTAILFTKVSLLRIIQEQTCLNDTQRHLQLLVQLLWVLDGTEMGIDDEVVVIGDHRPSLSGPTLSQDDRFGTVFVQFASEVDISRRNNFNWDTFGPLNSKILRLLSVIGNQDEALRGVSDQFLLE
ncbi:hypothetical protein WICPIJ_000553 [Wickerhamomyces pijperi]|uniref:Protein BZZ1 n=1 Tax=Wickerhamomyces pijperi TaxID=599730 RepID=A0A9P8TRU2_WICPI|nr:hypothetical protein WICPIJ_000553 [Wickerhamomyces pijperi]